VSPNNRGSSLVEGGLVVEEFDDEFAGGFVGDGAEEDACVGAGDDGVGLVAVAVAYLGVRLPERGDAGALAGGEREAFGERGERGEVGGFVEDEPDGRVHRTGGEVVLFDGAEHFAEERGEERRDEGLA